MAAAASATANHLLKTRAFSLLSRHRHCNLLNNASRFLSLSLSTNPLSSSSISLTTTTRRHVRSLCTSTDAAPPPPPPPPPPTASDSSSPATEKSESPVPDMEAVKEAAKLLDIRVGKVLKAWRHPDADSLYVEEVDIGEPEPRTICSGLVKYVPIDDLQDKKVVVLANLKPRNMRGIKSCGMLMAASDAPHENVELLVPPEDSTPGERIWFGLEEEKDNQPAAASPNQIQKKKVWESVQPHLKTDAACVAMLAEQCMRTSAGPVVSKSLKNANIS